MKPPVVHCCECSKEYLEPHDARPFSDDMRALCALPARNGGLGISNPMADAAQCHEDSLELTEKLRGRISASERELGLDDEQQAACKRAIRNKRRARQDAEAERIMGVAGQRQQRAMQLAQEKGASALFTALPLDRYGFALKVKQDFTDLVRNRYCLPIKNLPIFFNLFQPPTVGFAIPLHTSFTLYIMSGLSAAM